MIIVCPTHNVTGLYNLFIYSETIIASSLGKKIGRCLTFKPAINLIKR